MNTLQVSVKNKFNALKLKRQRVGARFENAKRKKTNQDARFLDKYKQLLSFIESLRRFYCFCDNFVIKYKVPS